MQRTAGAVKSSQEDAPYTLTRPLGNGLGNLILSAATPLTSTKPGNGGMRLWHYANDDVASVEALGLATGMVRAFELIQSRLAHLPQGQYTIAHVSFSRSMYVRGGFRRSSTRRSLPASRAPR